MSKGALNVEKLRQDFEQNLLDGDPLQAGQMIDSMEAFEYLAKAVSSAYREGQVTQLEELKYRQSKHFTSWGGEQGNCVPEDVIDERLAELQQGKA